MIYKLQFGKHWESGLGDDFIVEGVQVKDIMDEVGPLTLHFGHHNFRYVWNAETKQDVRTDQYTFYGGMGEGAEFNTWHDAVQASLYDTYQVYDELKNGDIFIAKYNGEIKHFACDGVHVVEIQKEQVLALNGGAQ